MTSARRCLLAALLPLSLIGSWACSSDPRDSEVPGATGASSLQPSDPGQGPSGASPPPPSRATGAPSATAAATPGPTRSPDTPAGREGRIDGCAAISALADHSWIIEDGMLGDAVETANGASTAILLLEGAELPSSLAAAREHAIIFFTAVSTTLAAVEVRPGQSTMEALEFSDRGDIVDALAPAKEAMTTFERHHDDVCGGVTP